jgi:hypothetical protein
VSYHDYGNYKTRWSENISKDEADQMKEQTDNPRIQVISPQKKLYDIQQIINSLPNNHMKTYELQEAIQKILDGE